MKTYKYKVIENPVILDCIKSFPSNPNLSTVIAKTEGDRYFVMSKEKLSGHTRVIEVEGKDGKTFPVVLCVMKEGALIISNTDKNMKRAVRAIKNEIDEEVKTMKIIIEKEL